MMQKSRYLDDTYCACGRKAILVTTLGRNMMHVECPPCEIRTAKHETLTEALMAWSGPGERKVTPMRRKA
jgi:hypothetical protein